MAVRPYWKGYLKLSLVTCAVTLTPATSEGNRVKFHTLNRKTGDRIYTRYVDAETGKTVDDDHQVKGYEKGEEDYVILEEEELDAVTGTSTTGHEWNGIKELDTPVPRAVLWFIFITHIWALGYWLLMPTWPLISTYTMGLLGVDQKTSVEQQIRERQAERQGQQVEQAPALGKAHNQVMA